MPEEITLDDGTKETVYFQDEVDGFKAGAEKNKERKEILTNLKSSLKLDEDENLVDVVKELSESNFAKYRAKGKADAKTAKNAGVINDENGNPINENQPLSGDEINKQIDEKVAAAINNTTNSAVRTQALSQFSQEDQDVIKPHFDKLMTSYPDDLQDNMEMAIGKAFPNGTPDTIRQTLSSAGGLGPVVKPAGQKDSFTDTDEGKQALSDLLPDNVKKAIADKEK